MKAFFYYTLAILTACIAGCSPSEKDGNNNTTSGNTPKLINETNGWHVLSGQRIAQSVGETPRQLLYENGHFSQSYQGMFYANSNTPTFDYVRANAQGDSLYIRNSGLEYFPFFYKQGDASDVCYGTYWSQSGSSSSHTSTGLDGIGPGPGDANTQLLAFPNNSCRNWKFSNPNLYLYFDGVLGGIQAYRIGTDQRLNMAAHVANPFSDITFRGVVEVDEPYCIANPSHVSAYYACNNNGISYNGHSPNYINIYTVDDANLTVFRDSTSMFRAQAAGADYKVACSDASHVYFLFSSYTASSNVSSSDKNVLLLVFDKASQKITAKHLFTQLSEVKEAVAISSKNQLCLNTNKGVYTLNLSDYSLADITPAWAGSSGDAIPPFAIATDGTKLFAIVGSFYGQYSPAVTNLIYFE